jgi:hypothetical protein
MLSSFVKVIQPDKIQLDRNVAYFGDVSILECASIAAAAVGFVTHVRGLTVLYSTQGKGNAMQSPDFAPESERYMMHHMNVDHADSNLMYVKVYGSLWGATAARMVALDKVGMDFEVTVPAGLQRLRIPFDHRLQDEADAQRTLVAMSRHAQTVLSQLAGSEGCRP